MPDSNISAGTQGEAGFRRKFNWLVAVAWTIPPIFGFSFLLFIEMFTPGQILGILTTPLMPVFASAMLLFALVYFDVYIRPLNAWLQRPDAELATQVRRRLRWFPLHFWGVFLGYLVLAPAMTILSAELYTDFHALPIDWFRIHLVALIVSIIVGLPVFFLLFDLFGRSFGQLRLARPLLTIKTRVFLIGALVPLLIDTMLVQYYWTRTGYFGVDTFVVWVVLELLAIAGSLLFLRSFGQSLRPVQGLLAQDDVEGFGFGEVESLAPASTDELGIISAKLHDLLEDLHLQHERLDVGNRMLRKDQTLEELDIHQLIVDVVCECFQGQQCLLMLPDAGSQQLVITHRAGADHDPNGYRRLSLDESFLFADVFFNGRGFWLADIANNDSVPPGMFAQPGSSSLMAVPLMGDGKADGVLVVISRRPEIQFGPPQLKRLEAISQEIALAARLVEERRARQRVEKAISEITEAVSTHSGEEFFKVLAEQLAHILQPDGVGISVLSEGETDVVETLVFWLDGEIQPNVSYPLAGTPCEQVIGKKVCVFGADVQSQFPEDDILRQMGIEAYLGIPLFDSTGRPLGLQFALFRRPLVEATFEESVMRIFAARVGLEIERQNSEEHIRYLAYFDNLTGLPNRQLLFDRLQQAIAHAERNHSGLAVMMLDLDHFKAINDSLGHSIGDHLLQEVARRLTQCIRHEDTVARLGGDEFVIMLQDLAVDTVLQQVTRVAVKIQEQLAEPYRLEGHELMVTPSLGIALFPDNGQSTEQLLKHADTALYKVKAQGRNNYRFFSAAMNTEAVERLEMENCLRQALDENEFELAFQPKVSIASGMIVGAEALLRWHNPHIGQVGPDRFIRIAEETGLILPIGQRVIELACDATTRFWCSRDDCHASRRLSINVSPRQFQQPDFVPQLQAILAARNTRPGCIELEITETVLLEGIDQVRDKLNQLKEMGITIAIDDFGTGYSSLSYLKQLPLDRVKIDRSFVDGLPDDADDAAIVQAILAMTRHLGIDVVAEGVETEAQLEYLRAHGCQDYQGFYYSKPVSADAFEALLLKAPGGRIPSRVC